MTMANPVLKTLAAALVVTGIGIGGAQAAGDVKHPKQIDWEHSGPFGTFDRHAVQRGFQVYKEICAACHSMKYIAFRNLEDIGFSEDQVKAIAAGYTVTDGPDDSGEMFEREGKPRDYLPSPFPNDKAAAAANGGKAPPDLSLMSKARHDGDNYIYSILTGYDEGAEGENHCPATAYPNPYFAGGCIAMPPPLSDDLIEYADGTPATAHQMAHDVAAFLTWTAEPKMEERKQLGWKVMLFLVAMSILLYLAKRQIWSRLH